MASSIDDKGTRLPRTFSSPQLQVTRNAPAERTRRAALAEQSSFTAAPARAPVQQLSETAAPLAMDAQPLKPSSVQAADHDYDEWKNSGAYTTRAFIDLMEQHKDDPDYIAELINRAKESSPGVLDYMMGGLNGAFMKDSGGSYADGFTDGDRQTIVDALRVAHDKGYLTDQEIRDRAATSPGWADVANRLGVSDVGVPQGSQDAVDAVKAAQDAYDDAHKEVEALDAQLQKELARFGPALTDKERAAYIEHYREAHHDAYAAEATAADALGKVVEANLPALERAAISDPAARAQIYATLQALAGSASPKAALEFAADLAKPENQALRDAFADHPNFEAEIVQPAVSGAAGELLAENGGDTQKAFAQLQALLQPLVDAGQQYGKPGYELFVSTPKELQEAWGAIQDAAQGKFDRLGQLAETWEEADGVGGLAKGIAAAALTIGAGLYGGVSSLQQGKYTEAVEKFASAGQAGLEVAAGATKALADAGKLAQYADKALSFADFASKLAPGLGIIANSAAFLDHLHEAGADGGNVGFAVAALGDAVGVLGSAIDLFPLAEPVGALVTAIGAGITALGELIGNFINDGKITAEERDCLKAAGLDDALIDAFVNADPGRVRELSEGLNLSPEQIQALTRRYSRLLEGTGRGLVLDNFIQMTQALGLTGDQVFQLLDGLANGIDANPNDVLELFMDNFQRRGLQPSAQAWRDLVHQVATDPEMDPTWSQIWQNLDAALSAIPVTAPARGGSGPRPV